MRDWLLASLLALAHTRLGAAVVDGSSGENKNRLP